MNELVGFVNGNNMRQKVLSLLASNGEMDRKRISKTLHIVEISMEKTLGELEEKELIVKKGEVYSLTETGVKIEKITQKI